MFEEKIKKLKLIDIKLMKWSVFFFAFFVATFISSSFLIKFRWLWFLIFIVAVIKPIYTVFKK